MILSGSPWPWKLTHRSIIGLKRLVNSSKINVQAQIGVLFWCGLNRAKFLIRYQSLKFSCFWPYFWPGTVTDFLFIGRVKKNISRKKPHHVAMLTLGYLWEEYEKFWFFIMCQIFTIWLGFSRLYLRTLLWMWLKVPLSWSSISIL